MSIVSPEPVGAAEQEPNRAPINRRGATFFASAIATSQLCALVRYVVLARFLGPTELGLAALIVLTSQFFDSITDSGSDRFLLQAKDGDNQDAQSLCHFVAIARGVIIAVLLLLLADPAAAFFEQPILANGLRWLAVVPLVGGFVHLDMRRLQREHDYRPEGAATIVAEVASLIVTAAAAALTASYLSIVLGLLARSAALVVMTQAMARRRYHFYPSRSFARRLALFGAPLMLNGLVIFFGSQGDRLLVGKLLSTADLGRYSVALLLIFYPVMVLQRFLAGIYLPQIVRHASDRLKQIDAFGGLATTLAAFSTAGFALTAPFVIPLLFGKEFAQGLFALALIGFMNSARFLKTWPVNVLLADGQSKEVLISNVVRLLGIPLAIGICALSPGLISLLLAFTISENLSLLVAAFFALRAVKMDRGVLAKRLIAYLILCTGVCMAAYLIQFDQSVAGIAVAIAVIAGLTFITSSEASVGSLIRQAFSRVRIAASK